MQFNRRAFFGAISLTPIAIAAPAILRVRGTDALAQDVLPRSPSQPSFVWRKVGEIEVFALLDGHLDFPNAMFSKFDVATGRRAARAAHKPFDPKSFTIGINAYLIRTKDRVVAVDAGSPSGPGSTVGGWARSLQAIGVSPDSIDTIFLTHMHADHVGGLTVLESGTKRLPRATFVTSEAEWNFLYDDTIYAAYPDSFKPYVDVSRAMVKPYGDVKSLVRAGAEIAPGLRTVALPGHTPGHLGLRVDSGGESLLIWGDIIHGTSFQFSRPDWSFAFDHDQDRAAKIRRATLDMASADNVMVAGMHLDFPGFGYVEKANQAYRFVAAPYDYRASNI